VAWEGDKRIDDNDWGDAETETKEYKIVTKRGIGKETKK
jgi:hypothetical protein